MTFPAIIIEIWLMIWILLVIHRWRWTLASIKIHLYLFLFSSCYTSIPHLQQLFPWVSSSFELRNIPLIMPMDTLLSFVWLMCLNQFIVIVGVSHCIWSYRPTWDIINETRPDTGMMWLLCSSESWTHDTRIKHRLWTWDFSVW